MGRPGLGWADAARSREVSSEATKACSFALGGLGMEGGGMAPARNWRTTFSRDSPLCATSLRFTFSSDNPAVCNLSLWHATQYCLRKAGSWARAVAPGINTAQETAS